MKEWEEEIRVIYKTNTREELGNKVEVFKNDVLNYMSSNRLTTLNHGGDLNKD